MNSWFTIIHEDDNILVINKESGISMHPAGRDVEHNLLLEMEKEFDYQPFPVMRLDRETSGIVIFAKNKETAAHLSKIIRRREMHKTYYAIVFGKPMDQTIKQPIGECVCDYGHGWKKCVGGDKPQEAITIIKTLKSNETYSLVEVKTLTGRQHQIRVHLAWLGHPLVGDKIYIEDWVFDEYTNKNKRTLNQKMLDIIKCERLLLHATELSFEDKSFHCALPQVFQSFIE